jgi:hypothetical protein
LASPSWSRHSSRIAYQSRQRTGRLNHPRRKFKDGNISVGRLTFIMTAAITVLGGMSYWQSNRMAVGAVEG